MLLWCWLTVAHLFGVRSLILLTLLVDIFACAFDVVALLERFRVMCFAVLICTSVGALALFIFLSLLVYGVCGLQ